MAVSIAQYVDLLFKKLQGVAKTANSATKSASNESIASPAFIRGDVVWMQSNQITGTASAITGISNARTSGNSVQCTADTTVPPIGGIRPTWLSNVTYWIPQEFGATWLPKVFVGPASAANIEATGTQIFAAGIGGVGEYYFDTQAGVLNFIGETIPTVLTAGNVVYISGYQYVGALGVSALPGNTTIGNIKIANTTITTDGTIANIFIQPTGNGIVSIDTTTGLIVPVGNITQRPGYPTYSATSLATIRYNNDYNYLEYFDGTEWLEVGVGAGGAIADQQITPDGTSVTYTLTQDTDQTSILVAINGVGQIPGSAYSVAGNLITFSEAPLTSDAIDIRFLASASVASKIINGAGTTYVETTGANTVVSNVSGTNIMVVSSTGVSVAGNVVSNNISAGQSLTLPSYTVAQSANISTPSAGQVIYVTNGDAGNPCLAVYSSGAWKRVSLGANISAT